jgi:hypothetical protein
MSCFGIAGIATVACWTSAPPEDTLIANRGGPTPVSTAYLCSIEDRGYRYPQFPCAIREIDGRLVLAKLGGSQRFIGEVRPQGRGFTFDGEFYCPWGDCHQALHGVFEPAGRGALRGTFRDASFVVTLVRAPAGSEWGGASYGGDGYGGFGYGGWGYGAYGPLQKHPGGNRRP